MYRRRFLQSLVPVTASILAAGCNVPPKAIIPSTRFQGRTRVACVGDSITAGAGLSNASVESYPAVLAQILGGSYDVRNFGVSGATLLKDGDLPYASTSAHEDARYFLPKVVVIALGTNDSKPQNWRHRNAFERDLFTLTRAFLTLPSLPTVYVCTPPTVFQDRWGITSAITSREIAPKIRRIAARQAWPVIDLETATRHSPEHFPDGIHPNPLGAASLAATVAAAFRGR